MVCTCPLPGCLFGTRDGCLWWESCTKHRDWVLSTHWLPLTLSPFPGSGGQRDFVGKVDLDACESSLLNRHGIVSTPKEPFPPQVFENEKFVLNTLGRNVRNFMNGGDRRGLLASDLLFFS